MYTLVPLFLLGSFQGASRQVCPAGFSANEPQVASVGKNVYLACGRGDSVFVLKSSDGGIRFGLPALLPTQGKLSLGMRRGPRVAISNHYVVVTAVYGQRGGGNDGDLVAFRSTDDGKSWRGPIRVSDSRGAAREGLHAMASSKAGLIACVWLDLRNSGTTVMSSTSNNGGETWSKNLLVYRSPSGTVCECCQPSVTFGPDGQMYVMFRNSLEGNRDMYLVSSRDGEKSFGSADKLGAGSWPIDACPMDGGAVTVMSDGTVISVWRRRGEVFMCRPGKAEVKVGDGSQPWIASSGKDLFATWRGANSVVGDDPVICMIDGQPLCFWADTEGRIWSIPVEKLRYPW